MVLSHETVQIDPYFPMEGKKKRGGVSPWEGYQVQMNTSLQTPNLCHVCYHSFAEQHDELG